MVARGRNRGKRVKEFGTKMYTLLYLKCDRIYYYCVSPSVVSILCDPMDCSPPGYSVCGILQAGISEWGCHALLQEIFPIQGSKPCLLGLLGLLPATWQALYELYHYIIKQPKQEKLSLNVIQLLMKKKGQNQNITIYKL